MHTVTQEIWNAHPARFARVIEVGPRDGLQNSAITLSVDERVGLIESLVEAGFRDVEVGSFVHPKWVPQMASTGDVLRRLRKVEGVRYWALVPNMKGLELALAAGSEHVAVFVSSSEAHNQRNLNRSVEASLRELREVMAAARREGLLIRGYISAVFGCALEGAVDFHKVMDIGGGLLEQGATELSLGDTTGEAQPLEAERKLGLALDTWGADRVALHLHDTRGIALVIATLAMRLGVRSFDASVGGLGGCPYAPGAAGNLATEDLINLLNGFGMEHGVNLDALISIAERLQSHHRLPLSSRYLPFALSRRRQEAAPLSPLNSDASNPHLACAVAGR